jgi:cold shock CspA family protein
VCSAYIHTCTPAARPNTTRRVIDASCDLSLTVHLVYSRIRSFGAYDLAGFEKAAVHYFRSWWSEVADAYLAGDVSAYDRPPVKEGRITVHLLDTQFADVATTAHVYSSATTVELLLDGEAVGTAQRVPRLQSVNWTHVFAGRNLTAIGKNSTGHVVGVHSRLRPGTAAGIVLSVDVPSPDTGTGEAVVADGQDVALIRAAVVDANGVQTLHSGANITFAVVSGPGRVIGVGNGDPACTEPNVAEWRSAYKGLARAVVQVNKYCAVDDAASKLLNEIDAEAGLKTQISWPCHGITPITVHATSPGLKPSNLITVDVSTDLIKHGVLETASHNVVF